MIHNETFNKVKNEIKKHTREWADTHLDRAKQDVNGEPSYVCPMCNHGAGGDGLCLDPNHNDGLHFHCFTCGYYGDLLDFAREPSRTDDTDENGRPLFVYGKTPLEAIRELAQEYKIEIPAGNITNNEPLKANTRSEGATKKRDFSGKIADAEYNLNNSEDGKNAKLYLMNKRGIDERYISKYRFGYYVDNNRPCLILPTSNQHLVIRYLDNKTPKARNDGSNELFNAGLLDTIGEGALFVTEGIFDAIAIESAGGHAVALNSTDNANALLDAIRKRTIDGTFKATVILALDNDNAGKKTSYYLRHALDGLTVTHFDGAKCLYDSSQAKDPNELLTQDRAQLENSVKALEITATDPKPDRVKNYAETSFITDVSNSNVIYQTGYDNLDKVIKGLRCGMLYTFAAGTSMGKTTFCHQLADQIAEKGNDVIYFSLEQTRAELLAKSIARTARKLDRTSNITQSAILDCDADCMNSELFAKATEKYINDCGDTLHIVQGLFSADINYIDRYINRFIHKNGSKPVVFIDYLQLLQPSSDTGNRQQTTKEVIDEAMKQLKQIAVTKQIPVVVICSINRTSYLGPINFESLKESGIIEFTADCIIALDFSVIYNDKLFKDSDEGKDKTKKREALNAEKRKVERAVSLRTLKNRRGRAVIDPIEFTYYSDRDYFEPKASLNDAPLLDDKPKRKTKKV